MTPATCSIVHQSLRKRLYTGDFDWNGTTYSGIYEALVSRECWQRVQDLLDARAENRTRRNPGCDAGPRKHRAAFRRGVRVLASTAIRQSVSK